MNWLITGGLGFIGSNLVNSIAKNNDNNIRIIDNLSVGSVKDLVVDRQINLYNAMPNEWSSGCIDVIIDDIANQSLANKLADGCDVIVHLAANTGVQISIIDPASDMQSNVFGTFNFLEAARKNGVKKFIFASSGAPIGTAKKLPIDEESLTRPISPYGASKLAGEAYCSAYFNSYKVDAIALRFSNVYGPGSGKKTSVVAKFIMQAMNNEELIIFGDGSQTRDFIYIDDLVSAILSAVNANGFGGEIFQIASGIEVNILDLCRIIKQGLLKFGIRNIKVKNNTPKIGDVPRNYASIEKAKRKLSWAPQISLEVGIDNTVKYFIQNRKRNA